MELTLTARQQRFVAEYAVDRNGAGAAVRAGYSARSAKQIANELLTKPDLQAAVAAQEARIAADLEVDRQRVLSGLLEAVDMARERADPAAMISAWKEVGRLCGYYAPAQVQVGVSVDAAGAAELWRLEAMSDEELAALMEIGSADQEPG